MPTSPRVRYKGRGRTGGEIGEAPPVADAARRFRGSAPIGGRDSGRESVGTTVGKRTPPLRKGYKRCGEVKNPPVTASPRQPPLGKGAKGTGDADCHSRCAHRLRNDTFSRSAVQARAGGVEPRPYGSVTRGAMGGRPQGSPLRRVTRGRGTAGRCRRSPLRDHFGFIYIGKFIFPGQKRNIYEYII